MRGVSKSERRGQDRKRILCDLTNITPCIGLVGALLGLACLFFPGFPLCLPLLAHLFSMRWIGGNGEADSAALQLTRSYNELLEYVALFPASLRARARAQVYGLLCCPPLSFHA
jgi:hypothetical protein